MTFEEEICPNEGKLITSKETASATILDDEDDVLKCSFVGLHCVEIDTSPYEHITLSLKTLKDLERLICDAADYYDSIYGLD